MNIQKTQRTPKTQQPPLQLKTGHSSFPNCSGHSQWYPFTYLIQSTDKCITVEAGGVTELLDSIKETQILTTPDTANDTHLLIISRVLISESL